jgi:hypothetical protein
MLPSVRAGGRTAEVLDGVALAAVRQPDGGVQQGVEDTVGEVRLQPRPEAAGGHHRREVFQVQHLRWAVAEQSLHLAPLGFILCGWR